MRNLSDRPLDILGIVRVGIEIPQLIGMNFNVNVYVLPDSSFERDLILGREFITNEKLTLVFRPSNNSEREKASLFTQLPLCISEQESGSLEQTVDNIQIDFGPEVKLHLKNLIFEIENREIIPTEDDEHTVRVTIKDPSIFAFAPRRFAHVERLQIRQIIDDLLSKKLHNQTNHHIVRE